MFLPLSKKCNELHHKDDIDMQSNINTAPNRDKSQIFVMSRVNLLIVGCILVVYCKGTPAHYKHNDRIIGGFDALDGSAPFMASLRSNNNHHFCGGAIITPHTILTASHCIFGLKASRTFAIVGSNTLSSGGIFYQVSSFRIHPAYNPQQLTNDIGLVIIDEAIIFDNRVKYIDLSLDYIGGGVTATLNGWGSNEKNSNYLQTISLKVITTEECVERISLSPIIESNLCTLTKQGEGVCYGDSGSPLIVDEKIVAIVSWGMPCAKGYPDVYTRVNYFIDWIKDNTV